MLFAVVCVVLLLFAVVSHSFIADFATLFAAAAAGAFRSPTVETPIFARFSVICAAVSDVWCCCCCLYNLLRVVVVAAFFISARTVTLFLFATFNLPQE